MDIDEIKATSARVRSILSTVLTLNDVESWLRIKLPGACYVKNHVNRCVVAQFIKEQLEHYFLGSVIFVASCAGSSNVTVDGIATFIEHDDYIRDLVYMFDKPNVGSYRDDILGIISVIRGVHSTPSAIRKALDDINK